MSKPTDSTIEIMLNAAEEFEQKALELRSLAKQMDASGDWSIAGEALSVCCNMANIRVDLLSVRPVRELTRQLERRHAT